MDKSKSEKLKEVLNQTLSTEEIEKKLKEEIKQSALKKKHDEEEKEKQRLEEEHQLKAKEALENLETPIERENHTKTHQEETIKEKSKKEETPLDKEVVIPTIRDKKKENKNMNMLLFLVVIIALLLLGIVVYLFTKDENKQLETKEVKVEKEVNLEKKVLPIINDKKDVEEKILTIKDDNKENKLKETTVSKIEKKIKEETKPLEKNKEIEVKKTPIKEEKTKEEPKPKVVIKEVIKEKIVTKEIKLNKENFKKYYNSSKYNTLKCYNFKAGDIFPDSSCKNDLRKFLKANKEAIRFEVIPVIAQDDNQIFDKMKDNIKQMDKTFQDRVKEYMFRGLSRERVLETSWQIKDILGEDTVLTPTNYYVRSKKNNKGIIIKAYH